MLGGSHSRLLHRGLGLTSLVSSVGSAEAEAQEGGAYGLYCFTHPIQEKAGVEVEAR